MKKNEIVLWGHRFVDDAIKKAVWFRPSNDGKSVKLVDEHGKVIKTIKEIKDGKQE